VERVGHDAYAAGALFRARGHCARIARREVSARCIRQVRQHRRARRRSGEDCRRAGRQHSRLSRGRERAPRLRHPPVMGRDGQRVRAPRRFDAGPWPRRCIAHRPGRFGALAALDRAADSVLRRASFPRNRGSDGVRSRRSDPSPMAGRPDVRRGCGRRADRGGRRDRHERSLRTAGVCRQDCPSRGECARPGGDRDRSRSKAWRRRPSIPPSSEARAIYRPPSSCSISAVRRRSSPHRTGASRFSNGRRARRWCTPTEWRRCCSRPGPFGPGINA